VQLRCFPRDELDYGDALSRQPPAGEALDDIELPDSTPLLSAAQWMHPLAPPQALFRDDTPAPLSAAPVEDGKCVRCWHRRQDVGAVAAHPGLCGRCVENVEGPGERREFA
jgi:isoleucyl-tRNA synthetase